MQMDLPAWISYSDFERAEWLTEAFGAQHSSHYPCHIPLPGQGVNGNSTHFNLRKRLHMSSTDIVVLPRQS